MAKIKANVTGPVVNHEQAYKHVHRGEVLAGTTRDGTTVHVASNNHRPLNAQVQKESLVVEHDRYDWKTGTFGDVRGDVLTNAQRHIGRLKFHAETAAFQRNQKEIDCKSSPAVASIPTLGRRY
jgi:hypothetical protein